MYLQHSTVYPCSRKTSSLLPRWTCSTPSRHQIAQPRDRAKGRCSADQTGLWPALPLSRLPTYHWSLSGKSDDIKCTYCVDRWGHSPSVEPDSGPMIVSRLQFPKGSSCSASCAQSQHLWGAMTRFPKTRPDHLECRSNCQPDRHTDGLCSRRQDCVLCKLCRLPVYPATWPPVCDLQTTNHSRSA